MFRKYFGLVEFFNFIAKDGKINQLCLSDNENFQLQNSLTEMDRLNSVTLALQSKTTTLLTLRYFFEEVINAFPVDLESTLTYS